MKTKIIFSWVLRYWRYWLLAGFVVACVGGCRYWQYRTSREGMFERAAHMEKDGRPNEAIALYRELYSEWHDGRALTRVAYLHLRDKQVALDTALVKWCLVRAAETDTFAIRIALQIYTPDAYVLKGIDLRDMRLAKAFADYAEKRNICKEDYSLVLGIYHLDYTQDYKKAISYFHRSVEAGGVAALGLLGEMYLYGKGVEKDGVKARQYFETVVAKEPYNEYSLHKLGQIYQDGIGVPKDLRKAIYYYRRSAAVGNTDSKKALEKMGKASPTAPPQ